MNHCVFRLSLILICSFVAALSTCAAIHIDTVPVGNAGNPNDPSDGDERMPGIQNLGSVPYNYRIGKFEVTNDQFAVFLNAKAASDPLNLFDPSGASEPHAGITRSGASGSFAYAVKPNMGNKPVDIVSWYAAIRFANWLHNGQGDGDTETGAYTILGGTATPSNGSSIIRNAGATWFLPTENEWYKAAYHKNDGVTGNYFAYPTSSDLVPTVAVVSAIGDISNPGTNVANYHNGEGGFLMTVGAAGPGSASPYGTYDQAGNVTEWIEQPLFDSFARRVRGGSWFDASPALLSSSYGGDDPSKRFSHLGFRVAAIVPEPASLVLLLVGTVFIALSFRRPAEA